MKSVCYGLPKARPQAWIQRLQGKNPINQLFIYPETIQKTTPANPETDSASKSRPAS